MDHRRDIDEMLPVVLKYGNEGFGDNWTFQQDDAKPQTQEWCRMNFLSKIMGPQTHPILILWTTRFGMSLLNKLTGPKLNRKRP